MTTAAPPDITIKRPALRIRGRSFIALVLVPEPPTPEWLAQLDAQMARAPGYFSGRPVVVDLSALLAPELHAERLIDELKVRGIRVIGVEGLAPTRPDGGSWGLPPMLSGGRDSKLAPPEPEPALDSHVAIEPEPEPEPAAPEPTALLVDRPVRSGQSVVFDRGDVTVVGSVASGAEVIAGGSIHVYGTLRGRAIAGLSGGTDTRIFCQRFEAELLAIDGVYKTADELGPALYGRPVYARLRGDELLVTAFGP